MVPVLDSNNIPLMPCTERRAKLLMLRGFAEDYRQKGIFCIRLLREPARREYGKVAVGIDPGSKREGYTVLTEKRVVLNITSNTPDWVKKHVETRRMLRRSRRNRKTPYRKCRWNRATLSKSGRIPPSTKARWDAKLRVLKLLKKILPITHINVEDISAISKEGKPKWNQSFSPLQSGKTYFYNRITTLYPTIKLIKTEGHETFDYRNNRGFNKSKGKLEYIWEAHNVDSHCLAEMVLNKKVNPYLGMYKLEFLEYFRRQLHVQNPKKKGIRKKHGSTVSMGMSRGSVLKYRGKLYYLGGTSKNRVSIYDTISGDRVAQNVKVENIKIMYRSSWRMVILSKSNNSSPRQKRGFFCGEFYE